MQNSQQKNEVSGVILAAGLGSRMGRTKQLMQVSDKPMVQMVLEAAQQSSLSKIILVLGYQSDAIRQSLDLRRVETLVNHHYELGLAHSIRIALPVIPDHHGAALFLLGDQPQITAEIIDLIVSKFRASSSRLVIPRYRNKRGNPVLIARSLFGELFKLSGDSGGRQLFEEHQEEIAWVDIGSDAILKDIDTLEDYKDLKRELEG